MNRAWVFALFLALAVVAPSAAIATTSTPNATSTAITGLTQSVGVVSGKLDAETAERVRLSGQVQNAGARIYALEHKSDFKWTEALTAIVALVALGVSIFSLVKQSPRVVVSATMALLGSMGGGPVSETMVSMSAANTGGGRVVLSSCGLFIGNGKKQVFGTPEAGSTQLPYTIESGDSARVLMSMSRIAAALKKNGHSGDVRLTAFFRDQTGRTHTLSERRHWVFWRKKATFVVKDIDKWAAEFRG